ncbi:hypothetical protein FRC06_008030 [Ceratobasidium sp. 370]|nr:hypothetical protein FRC06_008030 [Ceratobasidium sp. 370]
MATNDTGATICLNYLVEGDNQRTSTRPLRISSSESIRALADAIQADYKIWKGQAIVQTFLFKLETLENNIHSGITVNEDALLPFVDMISDHWPGDLPRIHGMIHILVRASLQENTGQAFTNGPTPLVIARVSEFHSQQHRPDTPIHNGRPREKQGLPLGIYHSIFPQFTESAASSSIPDPEALSYMEHLLIAAQDTYRVKLDRISAIRDYLEMLLGACLTVEEISGCKADGVIKADRGVAFGRHRAYTVIMEVKNIRKVSCCPSFIIAIAGPWICILGAVFAEKVIVHPLTEFLWMGRESHDEERLCSLTRTFCALGQSIQGLNKYYQALPTQSVEDPGRFFPYICQFLAEDNQTVLFSYSELLALDPVRPVFLATTKSGELIVVKFVRRYNPVAHRALAAKGLAPKLLYDSEDILECGMRMIVMEYVHAKNLHDYLSQEPQDDCKAVIQSIKTDLASALQTIHAEGLVFGDLRRPNVLVTKNGERIGVMLIDFDWCSQHQTGRYPLGLNDTEITWADGVKRGGVMDQKHDTGMLDLLFEGE